MTSEEARELLNRLIDGESFPSFRFPIDDLVIRSGEPNSFEDYTFRELIKTAYNLKDND